MNYYNSTCNTNTLRQKQANAKSTIRFLQQHKTHRESSRRSLCVPQNLRHEATTVPQVATEIEMQTIRRRNQINKMYSLCEKEQRRREITNWQNGSHCSVGPSICIPGLKNILLNQWFYTKSKKSSVTAGNLKTSDRLKKHSHNSSEKFVMVKISSKQLQTFDENYINFGRTIFW